MATPGAARSQQGGQHALHPRELVFQVVAFRAAVDDGLLDRDQTSLGSGGEHREVPGVTVVGRVESNDQRRVLSCHRAGPSLPSRRDFPADPHRRVERAPIEAGEERLTDVGRGANPRRRRGHLDATGAVTTDRVDHPRERGAGQGPVVDLGVEGQHRARHVGRHHPEAGRVDERRRPADGVRPGRVTGAAVAAPPLPQQRDHRTAGGELHRPDRDPPEPADARSDLLAGLIGAGSDEPTQHLPDRGSDRVGGGTVRRAYRPVPDPTRLRCAGRGEHGHHLLTVRGRDARARGPCDDPSRFPRHLQLDDARFHRLVVAATARTAVAVTSGARVWFGGESAPRGREPPLLGREVGEHLVALLALQRSGAGEVLVGLSEQAEQGRPPSWPVGFERGQLLRGGFPVGLRADIHVELPGAERCRCRQASSRSPVSRGRRRGRAPSPVDPIMHLPWWVTRGRTWTCPRRRNGLRAPFGTPGRAGADLGSDHPPLRVDGRGPPKPSVGEIGLGSERWEPGVGGPLPGGPAPGPPIGDELPRVGWALRTPRRPPPEPRRRAQGRWRGSASRMVAGWGRVVRTSTVAGRGRCRWPSISRRGLGPVAGLARRRRRPSSCERSRPVWSPWTRPSRHDRPSMWARRVSRVASVWASRPFGS